MLTPPYPTQAPEKAYSANEDLRFRKRCPSFCKTKTFLFQNEGIPF